MVVKIREYLKKRVSYFTITGLLITFIISIVFMLKVKEITTNKEIDKVLTNSYNMIENNLFEYKITNAQENETTKYGMDYDENISRLRKSLMKEKKISEAYLLAAYENIIYEKADEVEGNLKRALDSMKRSTSTMTKIYTGTLLAKLYVSNGDEINACKAVETSLSNIRKKDYNNHYEEIWSLMNTVIDIKCGINTITISCEEILDDYDDLSDEAELYLLMKMKDVYIKNNNFAKVSEYIIRSCYKAQDLQDNYLIAKCITDLGVMLRNIENREKAIQTINQALEIKIDNDYDRAYMNVYENINLAEIYCELERYKEAEMCIKNISSDIYIVNGNKYTDLEIRRLIILSEINFYQSNIDKGKKYLDAAHDIIENNRNISEKNIDINYELAYGRYLESMGKLKEALNHYSDLIKECVEKNDFYNERKIFKRIINITMINKESVLDDKYMDEIAAIIKNDDDIVYSYYSHYIAESVKSEIIIDKQKKKNKVIFKILFLSITGSIVIFIIFFKKLKILRIENQKDGLTKIYNRLHFNQCYEEAVRRKDDFAVVMIDVDNFKKLNDTYGHQFGDVVLVRICREISEIIDEKMKLFRYGGEEFAILCTEIDKSELLITAETIRKCVEEMKWDEDVTVTLSIGIADSKYDKENILKKADKNLYEAKTTGRNKVVG